jgi:hypothetical protein
MLELVPISLKRLALGTALIAAITVSLPRPAQADTSSTLMAVAAGAIVGALLLDGNNQPYYVNNNRKYYVSQQEASYWRSQHHVVVRRAYVPEAEYPVARNAGYRVPQQQAMRGGQRDSNHDQDRGNQGH